MSLPEIAQVARECSSSRELCENLVEAVLAKRRPKQDNTSVVALKIGECGGEPTVTRRSGDLLRRTSWVALALAIGWCATVVIGAILWPRVPSTGQEVPQQNLVVKNGAVDAADASLTRGPSTPSKVPEKELKCPRQGIPSIPILVDVLWFQKKRQNVTKVFPLFHTGALDEFLKEMGRCSGAHKYHIVALLPTIAENPCFIESMIREYIRRKLENVEVKVVFERLTVNLERGPEAFTMPLIVQASRSKDEENQ
jgi:hypothetical protein